MTGDDAIPDREQLRLAAARRMRRTWVVLAAVAILALFVTPVTVLLLDDGLSGTAVAVIVASAAAGFALMAAVLWWVYRRSDGPDLLSGADRGTRRAVRQALKSGHAADARIDALARESADQMVRMSWMLWLYAALLVFQLVSLVHRIVTGDDIGGIVLSAVTATCWALALVVWLVSRNRSRRYLAG